MTGSTWGVLIPLVSCLVGTIWVFGAMALLQIDINLITLVLASMMICVGSVYGIHVISRYEEEAATAKSGRAAAEAALRHLVVPVIIAGMTTIIGFAALLITDVPAVRELGLFSMLGIASITVLTLMLTGPPG